MTNVCIWCKQHANDIDEEHIFPEALGCPSHLVLPGSVVCKQCNNKLSHLDQAVADEFDFTAFMANIPRKRGRPPIIQNRSNVQGKVTLSGPEISFNMESYTIKTHDGITLPPYRNQARGVKKAEISLDGNIGTASFEVPFGQGKNFVRGINKVAFSALTYLCGSELALSSKFDEVRSFVENKAGSRKILVTQASDNEFKLATLPYQIDNDYCIEIRIGTLCFLVDLSNGQLRFHSFEKHATELYKNEVWFILPS